MCLTVLSVSYSLAIVSENTAGGAEHVLATLDEALIRRGHRSLVLAPEGSRCRGLLVPVQIPFHTLDENAKREAHRRFKQILDRTLARYRIDVVHMHGLDFFEYLPDADVPVVVSLHLPPAWYPPSALRTSRPNTKLVCVSRAQARTVPHDIRVDCVIPNGIDLRRFRPAGRKGNYVVAIGRICPEKGFHLAVEAAERARIKLVLAGTVFDYREHREYFNSVIQRMLTEHARFVGPIGGAQKSHLLAGAQCVLVPSLVPETSSLVAIEAMACGTPVIAWSSGALPEIVRQGKTGFLVNTVEEMAAAITRADSISSEVCRGEAEERFSAEAMVDQYLDLYRSLLTSPSTPELQAA